MRRCCKRRATRRGSHSPAILISGRRAEELKLLLYLFERDDAIKLMRAG